MQNPSTNGPSEAQLHNRSKSILRDLNVSAAMAGLVAVLEGVTRSVGIGVHAARALRAMLELATEDVGARPGRWAVLCDSVSGAQATVLATAGLVGHCAR